MTRNCHSMKHASIALVVPVLLVLAGMAADRPAGPAAQGAVTLAYQFPAGRTLSYQNIGTQTQSMDMMGQSMVTTTKSEMDFTVQPKGMKGQDFTLGVFIDAAKSDIESIQGPMSPDMSAVVGKRFDMVVGPLGREVDWSGAAALKVSSANGGEGDISPTFQAFFPDLPDKPIKVGDTWPSEDTVIQKSGAGDIQVHAVHKNTLDGFETVDGYECARIKIVSSGTVAGTLDQQGIGVTLAIKSESTGTFYFAVKEGIYVKSDIKGNLSGSVDVGAPANMSMAVSGETGGQTKLVKK